MIGVDAKSIPHGFGASITAQTLHSAPSSDSGFQPTSQIWTGQCGVNGTMTDPYPHPQHMKVVKHLLYAWSGCKSIPHWFGASTTAQRPHSAPSSDAGFQPTSQIWTGQCGVNGMMTDPYTHPQHMKVVKPLAYVWRGCENHTMWLWSPNHCTKASFSTKQ